MSADFIFLPKPEGDRHVEIRVSYKRLLGGKEPTAALLSVLEFLAKESLVDSGDWNVGDPIPDTIDIKGDCNFPRINALMDGWLKSTSCREKMQDIQKAGFISIDTETEPRHRLVKFHYRVLANALKTLSPQDLKAAPSKKRRVENDPPKNGGSKKRRGTLQKTEGPPPKNGPLTLQKTDPSRSLVDLSVDQKEDQPNSVLFSKTPSASEEIVDPIASDRNPTSPSENISGQPEHHPNDSLVKAPISGEDQCSAAPPVENVENLKPWEKRTTYGRIVVDDVARRAHMAKGQGAQPVIPPDSLAGLFQAGYGGLWAGPGLNDWTSSAIATAKRVKQDNSNEPTSDYQAKRYITNMVYDAQNTSNWGKVDLFFGEVTEFELKQAACQSTVPHPEEPTPAGPEVSVCLDSSSPPDDRLPSHAPQGVDPCQQPPRRSPFPKDEDDRTGPPQWFIEKHKGSKVASVAVPQAGGGQDSLDGFELDYSGESDFASLENAIAANAIQGRQEEAEKARQRAEKERQYATVFTEDTDYDIDDIEGSNEF